MIFGLLNKDIDLIVNILKQFHEIDEAAIFGSRSIGNYKKGSDIDIAIKVNINISMLSKIKYILEEELPLTYKFDVIDYNKINNVNLNKHIDQYGEIFYEK